MKRYFIADTHADTLSKMIDLGWSLDDDRLQVSVKKMQEGGHDLQVFACFIDPIIGSDRYISRTLQMIDLMRNEVKEHHKRIALCTSMKEIKKAKTKKQKIALMGIEGGHAIANDLAVLRSYRNLGIIYMTLTWSNTNDWADSSNDEERWGGLTEFGREVVLEMNRIKMIVDISHVSDKTFWDTLHTSLKPVIASHSSIRALCNHQRNMSDEMIKAMADKGGVIFINFYPCFIDQKFLNQYQKLYRRLKKRMSKASEQWKLKPEMYTYEEDKILRAEGRSLPKVKMDDVIRHIEYAVKIAGIEGVGLGSDYDGTPFMPSGMEDCLSLPKICSALHKRKFKPSEIDKIASGNFLRIFEEVAG